MAILEKTEAAIADLKAAADAYIARVAANTAGMVPAADVAAADQAAADAIAATSATLNAA